MKTLVKVLTTFAIMINIAIMAVPQSAKAQVSVSFQVFYDDLSPYGNWVYYSNHGYVWIPDYGPDFVPYYSNGYWAYTNYGWTWVSYYRWGWAPFHYGRWAYDDIYGWFWIPDDVWGPAWVCWRTGPGYYGWVPLGPGISFALAIGGSYNPPPNYWVFVNSTYMGSTNIYQYYSPRSSNSGFISNSQVVSNTYKNNYIAGPKKEDVEKTGGVKVKEVSIKERDKPGQSMGGNELSIYKPEIKGKDENAKPAKVTDLKEVKPVSERKGQKSSENNNEIKRKEPVVKENEPKKEMKKEQVPVKEKIQKETKEPNKTVQPKMKEQKDVPSQPNKEIKKQDQPPKKAEPKIKQPKDYQSQPNREIKKQEKPPKINQPNINQPKNPSMQPQREMKKPNQPPRMVQPNMNQPNNPPPRPQQKPKNPR